MCGMMSSSSATLVDLARGEKPDPLGNRDLNLRESVGS
ncbi:Uncharacterised protein [Gordonia terrae]|nr:Uncharacterised protein [Clostridioides difficile]VTS17497.1 Uncharacterised protein [Gordonia terrae]